LLLHSVGARKTLARIWEAHDWPSAEQVRQKVDRLSYRIITKTTSKNTFDTVPDLKPKDDKSKGSKCWAVVRYIPKVMMGVRPCGRESVKKQVPMSSALPIENLTAEYQALAYLAA